MNIEINIKLTKPLTQSQINAILELSENDKFLYQMAVRQQVFENLELDEMDFDPKVEVELV
jgi:hypothetical protein